MELEIKCLAIIPARGGSKRIKRKNVREFCGKPIIYYSVNAAVGSGIFKEVMASTDDAEIASAAESFGARVPFFRSVEKSNDNATLAEVALEVIGAYEAEGRFFDYVCMILPTAPFIGAKIIAETFAGIAGGGYDSLFPVVRFSCPIYRALDFAGGKVSMIWPENINKRSQDLKPAFHDAGQFYWINVKSFKEQKKIFMANSSAVELPETLVQDIDSEVDWKIAEIKYKTFIGVNEDEK